MLRRARWPPSRGWRCLASRFGRPSMGSRTARSIIRRSFERLIRARGIAPPRRVIDSASHLATLAIVAGTDALTAMSVPIVDHIGDRNKVKKVGIREKLTVGSYGLIQIKGRPLSPAALKVFEAIKRAQYGHRMS
jgi:hypothetical protein